MATLSLMLWRKYRGGELSPGAVGRRAQKSLIKIFYDSSLLQQTNVYHGAAVLHSCTAPYVALRYDTVDLRALKS